MFRDTTDSKEKLVLVLSFEDKVITETNCGMLNADGHLGRTMVSKPLEILKFCHQKEILQCRT